MSDSQWQELVALTRVTLPPHWPQRSRPENRYAWRCCPFEDTIGSNLYHKFYYKLRDKESAPHQPVFWQRRYDAGALRARLITPSGLNVCAMEYFGERWFPFERFYESLPLALRILFSVPGPAFSKLFLYRMDGTAISEPKTALLVLRKNQENRGAPVG